MSASLGAVKETRPPSHVPLPPAPEALPPGPERTASPPRGTASPPRGTCLGPRRQCLLWCAAPRRQRGAEELSRLSETGTVCRTKPKSSYVVSAPNAEKQKVE